MATYVSVADVKSRVGGRPLDATSNPSSDEVTAMLDEAEAEILGCLTAVGIEISEGTRGSLIVRGWIADYISGVFRVSYAAAAGDGNNNDGLEQVRRWDALKTIIREDSAHVAAMLSVGGTVSSEASNFRSYVTDNEDGKAVSSFAATISDTEVF